MSFPTDRYYLIQSKPELYEKLAQFDSDSAEVFLEKSVWKKQHHARSTITKQQDVLQIKILFLTSLYEDFALVENPLKIVVAHLLGEPPFSVEAFDQWWHIETIAYEEDIDSVTNASSRETLKLINATGDPYVDDWLQKTILEK